MREPDNPPADEAGQDAPGSAARDEGVYIQALALGLDPAWRRRDDAALALDAATFQRAFDSASATLVGTLAYSSIGLKPGVDLLLWRVGHSVDELEASAAVLLRSGLGQWLTVSHAFLGRIGPSQYVKRRSIQEQSVFEGLRARYLIVYPFTKSTDWYLTSASERQAVMNQHMKVGHRYPNVRQALAYSFGLDSQDFVVAYGTDDLAAFGELVRELRSTESRRATVADTPILLGINRPLGEILEMLGAPPRG